MAWYEKAVVYHIYPLGLLGAPGVNPYGETQHRLTALRPFVDHMTELCCNALYLGPLFESGSHGYDTTDYYRLDGRLGDNEDLKAFVALCHERGIRVIFDAVFNHTGRDFFAFRDLLANREQSRYRDWYCNVNFSGNNEFDDGFSYDNWGGVNLLAKLHLRNPEVTAYLCDVVRFWVREFDVDGLRLDAADVLDFDFMRTLRSLADEIKPEFWLMGEVIHGEYNRWVNETMLHSVTDYPLHKALYSGHNDHNYFEIAHTVKRLLEQGGVEGARGLYSFVDNHDVERIYTKLKCKEHLLPVHILLYTLPGIPSVYYGSEFGIEGKKEWGSDDSLRPKLDLSTCMEKERARRCVRMIADLGRIRREQAALQYGDYRELLLTNRQYAFSRNLEGSSVIITVNNDDSQAYISVPGAGGGTYVGALFGGRLTVQEGTLSVCLCANSGEIWIPREDAAM